MSVPRAIFLLTRDAARRLDQLARDEYAMPSIVLMENAARHAVDVALDLLEGEDEPRVLVLAGTGNNGGDGLAMARHLHNAGAMVRVLVLGLAGDYTGDAATNLATARAMGLVLNPSGPKAAASDLARAAAELRPDLIVDAMFGTGLTRELSPQFRAVVEGVNALSQDGVMVLSVDLPSGLDADKGIALPIAVRATTTVTFVAIKPGLLTLEAQAYVGDLIVADIGAPRELVERLGTPVLPLPGEKTSSRPRRRAARPRRRGPAA